MTDQDYLQMAIDKGNEQQAPRNFGAVIVRNGEVLAVEHNHVHEEHDPTLHAETSAIRAACKKIGNHNLNGGTMYGSHEPCLMCFSCAAWAEIDRIVYATPASEQGFSYEFQDLNLADIAKKLKKPIKIEQLHIEEGGNQ